VVTRRDSTQPKKRNGPKKRARVKQHGQQPPSADEIAAAVDAAVEAAATRQRLLDAAGAVFASAGYERAHVRDICARARANVAAIKYHFGGKYPLYEAAITWCFDRERRTAHQQSQASEAGLEPRAALEHFVRSFVGLLLDPEKPSWHAKLLAREMVEPTSALDAMILNVVEPTIVRLRSIIRRIVGPRCPKLVVERTMLSVIGQCVFYVHSKPVLERVFPRHVDRPDVPAIAQHIARFSIAGVEAVCGVHTHAQRRPRKAGRP
jgi:TetR/AcrR family transcriptional regulator, regulator of cefoperazone and chloramphenicol sensitivity